MHACRARARHRTPTTHCAKLWCVSLPIFEGCSRQRSCPQLQQPCAKTAWIGSTRPHLPRGRRFFCRPASAPEGSAKIRATRRAQDRRSPLTVKRTRAGAPPTPQRNHHGPHAAACAARARRSVPQKWLTRWYPASPGPLPHRRPPSPPRHHALPLRLPSNYSRLLSRSPFRLSPADTPARPPVCRRRVGATVSFSDTIHCGGRILRGYSFFFSGGSSFVQSTILGSFQNPFLPYGKSHGYPYGYPYGYPKGWGGGGDPLRLPYGKN